MNPSIMLNLCCGISMEVVAFLVFVAVVVLAGGIVYAISVIGVRNHVFFSSQQGYIYILQNTMVRGEGGKWSAREKNKNEELGEKMKRGKKKGGKLH